VTAQTSMVGLVWPASAGFFVRLRGGFVLARAMLTLWRQRSRERQQLALWLSSSQPGFAHDTCISCVEASVEASKPFWRA
jgi:uncharacterized protein YjiS (DUF1127 family)